MHLLARWPNGPDLLWDRLEDGSISLLPLGGGDYSRMRSLMHKYRDRRMDLADAALIAVAEREALGTIFTTDRKDFEVYRLAGRRRLHILP